MITQVYYRPHLISPGYNPIVWSVESDTVFMEDDFLYVFDIYINGQNNYTYRLKQRPNPVGVGQIDVSAIVTPFLNLTYFQAEEGSTGAYFENADKILANITVAVGEEYDGIIYDGTSDTPGNPNFFLFSQEFPDDNIPVRAIPSSFDNNIALRNMANDDEYGFYKPYIMAPAGSFNLVPGKFLKKASNTSIVREQDHHTLTFLNWNDYASLDMQKPVQLFKVAYQGLTGPEELIIYNKVSLGGGPQEDEYYNTATKSRETEMLTLKCGPKDLWPLGPVPSTYTVTAFCKTSSTGPEPGATASESVTFVLDEGCDNIFPTVRLSWLNELGGRDYYNFTMFYELTSDSKEEIYSQTLIDWSKTSPVNPDENANWLRGGNKSFNKTVTKSFNIQSDWLTQEQINFLGGIPESPSVWAYIGDDEIPVTVTVRNLQYQYKTIEMTKLAQASFDCQINNIQIKQNL